MKYILLQIFAFISIQLLAQSSDESWKLYDDTEVAIIEISINPDNLIWMYDNVQSDSLHVASMHFKNKWIDETVDSIGFRLRGNTSREAQKKSFKISFNGIIKGRKFYNVEKLNLNGEHNDPSIIRSKICWDYYQAIGMHSSRASHAAVYINGEYYGLYISVEHIDDEFIKKNFSDNSGNLWRCIWPADLTYRGNNESDYYPYAGVDKPYELKTNVESYDYSKIVELISKINLTPSETFGDSLETILVIPEFLKYLAMNVLVGSWDDYWSLMNNYYIYYEPKVNKFHWIPYDYDNTFGVDWFNVDWANSNPYNFPKAQNGDRPLADRIMNNAQYRNLYTHFLEFYNSNVIDNSFFDQKIDSTHTMITPFAEADSYRVRDYQFTINQFHRSYTSIAFNEKHVKRGIKEFIRVRSESIPNMISYLDAKPIIYSFDYEPKFPSAIDTIYVKVSAFGNSGVENINILYHPGNLTVVEAYPLTFSPVADTKKVEEADLWICKIPPLGDGGFGKFQIVATDTKSKEDIYPRADFIYLSSPSVSNKDIKLNELLASNTITLSDQDDEFDDWLELKNSSSERIDLSGLFLTDNKSKLDKWQFPNGTFIDNNKYLIIWCDEDGGQEGLHTNFKLSSNGEFLALVKRDGKTIIDSIAFPMQESDISFGRNPNSINEWTFMTPSPGKINGIGLGINDNESNRNFQLFQNYPNPFNPETKIKYSISQQSLVKLKIYDILGREISTLVNEVQKPGVYEIQFTTNLLDMNLTSGVYFYKLTAGKYGDVKKLILLR